MRTVLTLVAILLLLAQAVLGQTSQLQTPPQLVASNPQAGAVIRSHDIMLLLRFNRRIENAQCSLSLQMPTLETRTLPLQPQIASDEIEASGTGLKPGPYVLDWQITQPEGPAASGTVSFTVR